MTIQKSSKPDLIAIDVDGVLCDYALGFSKLAGLDPISTGAVRKWDWSDRLRRTRFFEARAATENAADFWSGLLPLTSIGERDMLADVAKRCALFYLTDRSVIGREALALTTKWLFFWGFPQGSVMILDKDRKVSTLTTLREEYVIRGVLEDNLETYRLMRKADLPCYLRRWPYNTASLTPDDWVVGSLAEFICRVFYNY